MVALGSGLKVLNGSGDDEGEAARGQGGAGVLDPVVGTIVDAQGGKVDGKAVEIFGEVVVGEEVEAE